MCPAAWISREIIKETQISMRRSPPINIVPPPAGNADVVLTVRNFQDWMASGDTAAVFKGFGNTLKPGGVLGIVDYRGLDGQPQDGLAKSGYLRHHCAIQQIAAAGFEFFGTPGAPVNKDTKEYPVGVRALAPTYLSKDQDREKWAATGQSDRFTLKFVKPPAWRRSYIYGRNFRRPPKEGIQTRPFPVRARLTPPARNGKAAAS